MWAQLLGSVALSALGGCLLCSEILQAPESKRWSADELRAAPPRELVDCLPHLAKDALPLPDAQHIWRTLVAFYGGASDVPDDKLALLRWVTPALEPPDYDNLTLGDVDVVQNFGLDYGLTPAQLAAVAERVREDWGGKEPEDYTHHDLLALRQILCAFNRSEIERIHPAAYRRAAPALGELSGCASEALAGLARLAVAPQAFGPPAGWSAATRAAVGVVASGLPPELARQIHCEMTTARVLLTASQAWGAERDDRKPAPAQPLLGPAAQVAARELRETPATREQALQHLRSWLLHNADVKNVRLDETFLLRFLRLKKFSIPMAEQTLLKYLNLRKYYPEMSLALDCEDPKLKEVFESGYIVVSPVRDSQGRKVIMYDMGKFDAHKFGCWEMARAHLLVYESLLEEQENQVLGFTHVGDGSGVGAAHLTAWNPIHFARLMKWGEQSIPMRHKEIHLINIPSSIKYVLDFACSKLSSKIVSRLHIHSNLKALHNVVDRRCLPSSCGGHVALADALAHTRRLLLEQRPRVLGLDFMQLVSARGIRSGGGRAAAGPDVHSIQGSFRKLEID